MKKIISVLAAVMLVAALSVSAFAAEATVTGSWTCTFTDNDYDSGVTAGSLTGYQGEVVSAWGNDYPELVSLIETVAPIASVSHVAVTVKASNTDDCWSTNPKIEVDLNERGGEHIADAVPFDGDTATFEFDVPADTTALVLVPYAFSADAGEISFEISMTLTGDFEAPETAPAAETETAPEAEAEAPAEAPAETPAETPAEPAAEAAAPAASESAPATGLALAVIPAVIALGAAAVSKKH